MNDWDGILARMCDLRRDSKAAKHKPLLLLWLLAQVRAGSPNAFSFHAAKAALNPTMATWTPRSTVYYPFWALQNDGLWLVDGADALSALVGGGRPPERTLSDADSVGRLVDAVWAELRAEPSRVKQAAERILTTYWSTEAERAEALRAVGMSQLAVSEPVGESGAGMDPDAGVEEGSRELRLHLHIERDSAVVLEAKLAWAAADPKMPCECCGSSFIDIYGSRGEGYIEAHHRDPLHAIEAGTVLTKVADLAAVCSNCHSMLHRRPYMNVEELRALLCARADTAR